MAIEECSLALLYCNFCFCVTKVGYRNKLICKNNNSSINFYDNFIKLLQIYHARVFQYKSESLVIHFKLQCKNYAIFIWSRVSRKLERKLLLQLVGTSEATTFFLVLFPLSLSLLFCFNPINHGVYDQWLLTREGGGELFSANFDQFLDSRNHYWRICS